MINFCRVYTCRFDNQVPNGKLVKKYFLVVKLVESCFHKRQISFLVVKIVKLILVIFT